MNLIKIKYLENVDIEKHATIFLQQYWDQKIPLNPELILRKKFDVRVIPLNNSRATLGMSGSISIDFKSVYVDEREYSGASYRINFTIAHELAHKYLHEAQVMPVLQTLKGTGIQSWKDLVDPTKEISRAEYQAYYFAGLILVPTSELKRYIGEKKIDLEHIRLYKKELSDFFQVSEEVIEKRIDSVFGIKR